MPRKPKSQDGNPYEIIRGMWEGAYVSHFIRLFRKKFGFNCLTTQELEEALVEEESVALADIFARLLRYVTGNVDILIENFHSSLRNLLTKEKAEVPRFLDNGTTWQDLVPEEKLGILKWLIDHVYQTKEEDISDFVDENYSADDLRGICAGQDAFKNIYWYLDDLRLYREFSHKKQNKKDWECVCITLADWQSFIKQFRKTSNLQEKELYSYLNFELFPIIELEFLNNKKPKPSKEEVNKFLLNREQEDLDVMLEKKNFLDCVREADNPEVNGTDTVALEKTNNIVLPVKISNSDDNDITEFLESEEKKSNAMNHYDGDLNIDESICSIANSLTDSAMDIKTSTETDMCSVSCLNSCSTSCNSKQDVCTVVNNTSSASCSNGANCNNTNTAPTTSTISSSQDVSLQQPLSDIPSDSSSVTSNKENAPPSSVISGNDIPPMSAMSNMVGSTVTPATTASVQPLPSNMVNKTTFQMETQYMQQQSQIFVFSTALANKAAESYLSGHFPSMIAFHCAQPGTKSFLEKYPLKVQQFNRQNPAAWLNSLAQMKQAGRQIKNPINQFPTPHTMNSRFPGPSGSSILNPCTGSCNMHVPPGMCSNPRGPPPWPSNCGNPNMQPMPNEMCNQPWPNQAFNQAGSSSSMNHRFPNPVAQGLNIRPSGPPLMGCMNNMAANIGGAAFPNSALNPMQINQGPGGPTTLTGVKVPDENLTPQQRQHREEQLAIMRKMHQLLFPEQQMDPSQSGMNPNIGPNGEPMITNVSPQQNPQTRFGPGEMCVHSGMDMCFSPHQACSGDHDHSHPPSDMFMGSSIGVGPGFPPQNFSRNPASAQLEWQKLQQEFYGPKKPGCGNIPLSHPSPGSQTQQSTAQPVQSQQSLSQPQTPQQNLNSPSPGIGLSPGNRMQGPPPPYHQTNKRSLQSPHPASPTPSSLSMPSPRMASGLSSPGDSSRQFPIPTPPGPRLTNPSPGSTTPVGSNSLHTTPLNSPKPSTTSGPGSNNATIIKTPSTPSNTIPTPSGTPTSSCTPALPNSAPSTPAGSCSSSRKQTQSCNSDVQDSNSVGSTINLNAEFPSSSCSVSTSNSQGELFCHDAHPCNQSTPKQENCSSHNSFGQTEPSLMPVPSPQQIQYLNAFDGQELTIQKQPNTSIRELDIMSPASITPSMVMSTGSHSQFQSPDAASFPNTPGSCPSVLENSQDSMTSRFPVSAPPSIDSNIARFPAPSPQMPGGFDSGPRHMMPSMQTCDNSSPRFPGMQNMDMMRMPSSGPMNHNPLDDTVGRFLGPNSHGPMFDPMSANSVNCMSRFPGSASEAMQRFRGPSPHSHMDMGHPRFMGLNPHMSCVDNLNQPQFNNSVPNVTQHSFPNSGQPMSSRSSPCVGSNFLMDGNMPHSHLQNLQKMTPPFDSLSTNKISPDLMSPMGQCSNSSVNGSNSMGMPPYGGTSPLTPSSQVGPSQRLSHFDPIASMAAMSESTAPLVTVAENPTPHQNAMVSNMNMGNMRTSVNNSVNNISNMPNFHNIQSMPGGMQSTSACSLPNQQAPFNQLANNIGCNSQNGTNAFASSTPMQQLNAQNAAVTTGYNAAMHGPNMNPHQMHLGCQGSGANTISCSVTTNHPIMHTSVTTKTSNSNISLPGPRHGSQNFPSPLMSQRAAAPGGGSPNMMPRGPPFNSTNIQVKANAPNTIQYLPARQQNPGSMPTRAPTLEFLQRYATPLTNLDNKLPTHNLQYFPNNGTPNSPANHGGVGMNSNPGNVAPGMMNSQRPVNMMMGPMMRRTSPNTSHPAGQIFPVNAGLPGPETPMFGRPPCPSVNNSMISMNSMSGNQGVSMFPNKQMPLPMGGMAPDATQPLPPSMGQSFNYKQSQFYGPTTADPNYAVQFHNFQQQLYATNTRGSQMNSQNNMGGPGLFGPK